MSRALISTLLGMSPASEERTNEEWKKVVVFFWPLPDYVWPGAQQPPVGWDELARVFLSGISEIFQIKP